jgi:hypothetical protein
MPISDPLHWSGITSVTLATLVPTLALTFYIVMLWAAWASRDGSAPPDDHVGLKCVAATILVVGVAAVAFAAYVVLQGALSLEDVEGRAKSALPDLVTGVVMILIAIGGIFPRTNIAQHPKARRLAMGALAIGAATVMLVGYATLVRGLVAWTSWAAFTSPLAGCLVATPIFAVSVAVLMRDSGVGPSPARRVAGAGTP